MILVPVLIAFALEYYFRWGAEYRNFGWFNQYLEWLESRLGEQSFFAGWGGVLMILLLPVIALLLALSIFSGPLYYIALFLISVAVFFYCLGPKPLLETMNAYYAAMERDDKEAAYLTLQQENNSENLPQSDDLVRNATRFALVESNKRYFGVVCWFTVLGPFGALFYRLAHQYRDYCVIEKEDEHFQLVEQLLHWVDWVPARATSFLNLLTGDFVAGFYRLKDYLTDIEASNEQVLSETGISALGLQIGVTDCDIKENYAATAMARRTAVFYVVIIIFYSFSPLAFWI